MNAPNEELASALREAEPKQQVVENLEKAITTIAGQVKDDLISLYGTGRYKRNATIGMMLADNGLLRQLMVNNGISLDEFDRTVGLAKQIWKDLYSQPSPSDGVKILKILKVSDII